jgi:hypothetical protein
MSEETTTAEVTEEVAAPKRDKKLTKSIEGTVITIEAIGGEKGVMTFDVAELSEEVCQKLIPFGASHKLGDAAAGRTGKDAEEAIQKVWDGLLKGDWSVRQAAAPKVSITQVKDALANMSDADREKAKALMAQMGINL